MMRFWLACALALSMACGSGGGISTPSAVAESLELRIQTDHFRIFAGTAPNTAVQAAADRLEAEYARIITGFGLSGVPMITVRIWQDETTYFNELTRYFGVRYQAAGYITGPAELRVLAVANLPVNVVHEFVHAASMWFNPSFANNPRWLWEAVERSAFPTLQQLNADPNAGRQVYEVGYLLGEFIVSTWGRPAYLRLIQANADLPGVLGVSTAAFESAWQSYVRQRYLS